MIPVAGTVALTAWALVEAWRWARFPSRSPGAAAAGAVGPVAALRATPVVLVRKLRTAVAADRDPAAGLPEAVEVVASAVRAGRSPHDGLAIAARSAPPRLAGELRRVTDLAARGVPLSVALERWAASSEVGGASLVTAAVGLAVDAGGDAGAALAGVAETLRERRALRREIRALSAQARLSATIIAAAPVGFASMAVAADGETARFLLGSPGGLACLATGLLLDVAGFRWMRRIAASVR